jgi:hypothetical protein
MANTYVKIASVNVGILGAANMEFTSIPSTYTDLLVVTSARTNAVATNQAHWVRFNGDTGNNYSAKLLEGNGASAASYNNTGYSYIYLGEAVASTATANTFGSSQAYIPNYLASSQKSVSVDGVSENNASTAYADLIAGLWTGTAAINQITILPTSGNFVQYSTATLYGILKN